MTKVDYISSYEQLDRAIIEKLSGCVVKDGNDKDKKVPVRIFSPDLDLVKSTYPMFVLYRQSEMPDFTRWSIDEVRDNYIYVPDAETGVLQLDSVDKRDNPEPWIIIYAVRLYSDYHEDMNTMKWFFRKKFPRSSYVEVNGQKYDVSHMGFDLSGSGYKDFGVTEDGLKKLTEQYLLRVEVNLDLGDRETVKVTKVIIPRVRSEEGGTRE